MENAKRIARELKERYDTEDPFQIAEYLGIHVQTGPLGNISGCCLRIAGHRFIYINSDCPFSVKKIIAAHELGHAVMHNEDYYFFSWEKSLPKNKAEMQANAFAAELLIPTNAILDNPGMTIGQLARLIGCTERLLNFKRL